MSDIQEPTGGLMQMDTEVKQPWKIRQKKRLRFPHRKSQRAASLSEIRPRRERLRFSPG